MLCSSPHGRPPESRRARSDRPPTGPFAARSAAPSDLPQSSDRHLRLEHRRMDAGDRCRVADGEPDTIAAAGRPDADRHQPAGAAARAARWGHGGPVRSPASADAVDLLDARDDARAELRDVLRAGPTVDPAARHVPARRRDGDERSDLAGHRAGAGTSRGTRHCGLAERCRLQSRPRHRPGGGRLPARFMRRIEERGGAGLPARCHGLRRRAVDPVDLAAGGATAERAAR